MNLWTSINILIITYTFENRDYLKLKGLQLSLSNQVVNDLQVSEGWTGHTEAVKVNYDKRKVSYKLLCKAFWESHDPTNKEYLVISFTL